MIPAHPSDEATRIRAHARRALVVNRQPGFHFPGHFLDIRWPAATAQGATLEVRDDVHLRDATGALGISVLALLADTALSTATRGRIPAGARLGTMQLQLQLTGTPARGDVIADAVSFGAGAGAGAESWLGSATLSVAGTPICYTTGQFMRLDAPPGVKLAPLPWQQEQAPPETSLDERDLAPTERAILDTCDSALQRSSDEAPFLDRFWHGERQPARDDADAQRLLVVGPHVSNRVGHVQGGILLGLAAATACDATAANMTLANVTAWYVRPGRGDSLTARARVLHAGRTTALVNTQVVGPEGVVLEATTQHVLDVARTA